MKAQIIYKLPVAVTVEIDDEGNVIEIDTVRELGDLIAYDETQHAVMTRDNGTEWAARGDGEWARRIRQQADKMEWPARQ